MASIPTTDEALDFCKASEDQRGVFEDTLLPAVIELVETATRKLSKGQVVEHFDGWPDTGRICLRHGPISEIQSIEQSDTNGCFHPLTITDYEWQLETANPWVAIKCGACQTACGCQPRLRITYVAGPEKCEIPARARLLILQLVSTANTNRNSDTEANLKKSPIFDRLIKSLKKPRIH